MADYGASITLLNSLEIKVLRKKRRENKKVAM
jgi:hypothetical protein